MEVYGTRTAPGLRQLISLANSDSRAEIDFTYKMKADSDHWPFFERRIPVVMFHTGLHEDYHRPSDDSHRINHDGLRTATSLAFHTLIAVADAEQRPAFRPASTRESPATQAQIEQPISPNPPRYGFPFQVLPGEPPQVMLTGVNPGTPAEAAGFKTGDRLVSFQGEPITDEHLFRLQLLAASGETTFVVQREGEAAPIEIKLTPAGSPIRVGISWRLDEGEPGAALLTQVIYGSAAHRAGLQLRDRIYSVAGQRFTTQEEVTRLLKETASPIELLIERAGKLQTVKLETIDAAPPSAE
jgi:C-terminal processing protease CtpA/Prc